MGERIFTTAALIYANGQVHLGHLVEYIMTDIWTRYQKLRGRNCVYCCADDAHGTPIMVWSKKENKSPEELIRQARQDHLADFRAFGIAFDHYHSTHSEENRRLTEEIFTKNLEAGNIDFKPVRMFFCEHDSMFLPDRFVRGACPRCGAAEQYGDHCEVCNAPYRQVELEEPRCTICGRKPVERETRHAFFKLPQFAERLREWIGTSINPEIANELRSKWLDPGLRDWDFTRDAPYFGFEVPGNEGLFFYVWWDAPIGYFASLEALCRERGWNFREEWLSPETRIVHFIGKDIAYHHGIYWPAMLMGAGFPLSRVQVHGFLTVNGSKMSKSRGTFINAKTYLKHLDPQYLRYYYACKTGADSIDMDLSFDDLASRINSDLVGKLANIPSRTAPMLKVKLGGKLGRIPAGSRGLLDRLRAAAVEIADLYERVEFREAMRRICLLADEVNRYIDDRKPWYQVKEDPEAARETVTVSLNAARILALYLKPVLPDFAVKMETLLGEGSLSWEDLEKDVELRPIGAFERMVERVDPGAIKAMIEETKSQAPAGQSPTGKASPEVPAETVCSFDEFMKVDLRVARIVEAGTVEGADKLLRLVVDLGPGGKRTVFAGIKSAYRPEDLLGRLVVVAANLAPRKMKFGVSEGMVLASGEGGKDGKEIHLLAPDPGAEPGQRVH